MTTKTFYKLIFTALLLLIIVYGCSDRQKIQGQNNLMEFRQYTDSLDRYDMHSVHKALNNYKLKARSMSQEQKDSAFIYFRDLYYTVVNNSNETFHRDLDLLRRLSQVELQNDPKVVEFNQLLEKSGMEIQPSEGFFSLDEKPRFLYDNFREYVSRPVKEFLRLRMEELEKGFAEDAALTISFEELGERAIVWERYLSLYNSSPLAQDAGFFYNLYLGTFMTGMDNSRVFDPTGNLAPEMKRVYSSFIEKHKGSRSAEITEEFMGILAKNGYRYSPEVEQFFEEYRLEGLDR